MSGAAPGRIADLLRFGFAWTVFGPALRRASFARKDFVAPPAGPRAAGHLTLVARLPSAISERIGAEAGSLLGAAERHHAYPASTIHVTIQNLDVLREEGSADEVCEKLRARVAACAPIRMIAAGFGVSPDTVFVQLFPIDRTLAHLRRDIRALIAASRRPGASAAAHESGRSRRLFRDMAFANVIRFSGPVAPSLVRDIRRYRSRSFGALTLDTVELVMTDRFLSAEGTKVLERIALGGTGIAR